MGATAELHGGMEVPCQCIRVGHRLGVVASGKGADSKWFVHNVKAQ